MAFSPAVRAQLIRSALSMIAASNRERGYFSLSRQLERRFGQVEGQGALQFQGVARSALSLWARGQALNERPAARPAPAAHATDPDVRTDDPTYRYRVAVHVSAPGFREVSFSTDIRSPVPMSRDELEAVVRRELDDYASPRRSTRSAIAALGSGATVSVEVISAGRR